MAERLTRGLMCERFGVQIPDQPNLTQHCKRFATASTSTNVAVLPWRYDAEMGSANSLHASASITKGIKFMQLQCVKLCVRVADN